MLACHNCKNKVHTCMCYILKRTFSLQKILNVIFAFTDKIFNVSFLKDKLKFSP